jgi:hypothetical protein
VALDGGKQSQDAMSSDSVYSKGGRRLRYAVASVLPTSFSSRPCLHGRWPQGSVTRVVTSEGLDAMASVC